MRSRKKIASCCKESGGEMIRLRGMSPVDGALIWAAVKVPGDERNLDRGQQKPSRIGIFSDGP